MEDYSELIKFAKSDYYAAKILIKNNNLNNSLFHCQQCLEKLMKAGYIFIFNEEKKVSHKTLIPAFSILEKFIDKFFNIELYLELENNFNKIKPTPKIKNKLKILNNLFPILKSKINNIKDNVSKIKKEIEYIKKNNDNWKIKKKEIYNNFLNNNFSLNLKDFFTLKILNILTKFSFLIPKKYLPKSFFKMLETSIIIFALILFSYDLLPFAEYSRYPFSNKFINFNKNKNLIKKFVNNLLSVIEYPLFNFINFFNNYELYNKDFEDYLNNIKNTSKKLIND